MRRLFLLIVLSCLVGTASPILGQDRVWWGTETYEPSQKSIEGISLRAIDPTWIKALGLSNAVLSSEAKDYLQTLSDTVSFAVSGDFNGDHATDRAIVGVYETAMGAKGKFFLILTRKPGRHWQKAFLKTIDGTAGFSYIAYAATGEIVWAACFECDAAIDIVWKEGIGYQVDVPSDEEE